MAHTSIDRSEGAVLGGGFGCIAVLIMLILLYRRLIVIPYTLGPLNTNLNLLHSSGAPHICNDPSSHHADAEGIRTWHKGAPADIPEQTGGCITDYLESLRSKGEVPEWISGKPPTAKQQEKEEEQEEVDEQGRVGKDRKRSVTPNRLGDAFWRNKQDMQEKIEEEELERRESEGVVAGGGDEQALAELERKETRRALPLPLVEER